MMNRKMKKFGGSKKAQLTKFQHRSTDNNTETRDNSKKNLAAEIEKLANETEMLMTESNLGLKLLIDNKSNRGLYAEASKDVIDFLFGLLTLPLGRVCNLLLNEDMIGSISALRNSLEQLDESYVASNQMKESLLNPSCAISSSQIPEAGLLLRPHPSAMNIKFYRCNYDCNAISEKYGTNCTAGCQYGIMNVEMQMASSKPNVDRAAEGGYVKGVVTYSVMDDLTVVPMSTISSITLLDKFQIKDLTALEEHYVFLGVQEALGILKASVQSKTVLTDVFLAKDKKGA